MLSYDQRLRIWETDYGREAGWLIELRGEVIAVLTDPQWEDIFWTSYRMEVATSDSELGHRIKTLEFWGTVEATELIYRSREFGVIAELAFPALNPSWEPDRLMMRRLCIPIGLPWVWDRIALWWRRRRKRRHTALGGETGFATR